MSFGASRPAFCFHESCNWKGPLLDFSFQNGKGWGGGLQGLRNDPREQLLDVAVDFGRHN